MKTKLASINLEVADPEQSKRFYVDVLGMVEDTRRSHPPGFVYLRSDGCDVTLATPQEATGAEPSRTMELGFEVDDIAAMKAHLAACGVAITARSRWDGVGHGAPGPRWTSSADLFVREGQISL